MMRQRTWPALWRVLGTGGLVVLIGASLAGCNSLASTPALTATPAIKAAISANAPVTAPTATLLPTAATTLEPPGVPTLVPRGEWAIAECQYLQPEVVPVKASAERATSFEWQVQDKGGTRTLDETGDSIRYSAPCNDNDTVIVTAWARNSHGLSAPASLIIRVPSPIMPPQSVAVPLDALAVPEGWTTGTGNPPDFIHLARGNTGDCHTGLDCYRIQYDGGAGNAAMLWWPPCPTDEQEINCRQEDQPGSPLEGKEVCVAHIRSPNWPAVVAGRCKIDVNKSGNIGQVARLTFWVRGEQGGEIVMFAIGDPTMGPEYHSLGRLTLSKQWKQQTIDLSKVDLSAATILFKWAIRDDTDIQTGTVRAQPAAFYLDDVQFEGTGTYTSPPQSEASGQNVYGQPTAAESSAETASLAALTGRFADICWIGYSPTHFDPTASPARFPTASEVSEDLRVLHTAGFTGLVTYGSNYPDAARTGKALDIPALAQEAGFAGVIVGVWDPTDDEELQAAEATARNPVVLGYSIGNEGLDVRYTVPALRAAMDRLREATGKPVTTSEQSGDYVGNSPLWEISDWIFPNAHPYFAKMRDPSAAVAWTQNIYRNLDAYTEKSVLLKEVGLPTSGDIDLSEKAQAAYYRGLQRTDTQYVVFEAFDAPWKHLGSPKPNGTYWPDPEPHWGIFTSDRQPKTAAQGICRQVP